MISPYYKNQKVFIAQTFLEVLCITFKLILLDNLLGKPFRVSAQKVTRIPNKHKHIKQTNI